MERVNTLIQKLQHQFDEKASADKLLITVQMLHAELMKQQGNASPIAKGKVTVLMPANSFAYNNQFGEQYKKDVEQPVAEEEKIIEILQVDEQEIEEELEEIKRNAEAKYQMGVNAKSALLFDPVEEVPTLTHQTPIITEQKNINDAASKRPESLNEKLKQSKIELSDMLTEAPVRDLKKAIGINDRFLFINELFRGDEAMYERSIKTINNFAIFPEAQYWIQRELKVKIGWSDADPVVKQFDQLVKRRFS
jgi:hypothetical protein